MQGEGTNKGTVEVQKDEQLEPIARSTPEGTNQGTVEPKVRSEQEVEVKRTKQGTVEQLAQMSEENQPRTPLEALVIDPHAPSCELILDTTNLPEKVRRKPRFIS